MKLTNFRGETYRETLSSVLLDTVLRIWWHEAVGQGYKQSGVWFSVMEISS